MIPLHASLEILQYANGIYFNIVPVAQHFFKAHFSEKVGVTPSFQARGLNARALRAGALGHLQVSNESHPRRDGLQHQSATWALAKSELNEIMEDPQDLSAGCTARRTRPDVCGHHSMPWTSQTEPSTCITWQRDNVIQYNTNTCTRIDSTHL